MAAAAAAAPEWRRQATPEDRQRLRGWRTAWTAALAEARATGEGAAAIAADPTLYDPDRALLTPLPPAGTYRCRTIKLGNRGAVGLGFIACGWFRCRVDAAGFSKVDGSQRPVGGFLPDTDARAVFLGTLVLGDEARAMPYGRDRSRDLAGLVERIGERRWRIAFPMPAFESKLDLIELRPAS